MGASTDFLMEARDWPPLRSKTLQISPAVWPMSSLEMAGCFGGAGFVAAERGLPSVAGGLRFGPADGDLAELVDLLFATMRLLLVVAADEA